MGLKCYNIKCFSMVSLKVDNLTYRTNDRDLEYLFEKYGKVIVALSQLNWLLNFLPYV